MKRILSQDVEWISNDIKGDKNKKNKINKIKN